MTIRVAINGFGRIGRNVLRALYESKKSYDIKVVAINDLGDAAINAHLLKYDTAHGIFQANVEHSDKAIFVNQDEILTLSERNPANLPWADLKVDVVLECTGLFTDRQSAGAHLTAGAKKVIISAPAKDVDATVVYGVNHNVITSDMTIISNASCTTNCLSPIAKPLNDVLGIESGLMTTIHAYTNDQVLTDVYHKDMRRARSATMSMIPTKTGAAKAVGLVLPELQGKFDGFAMRVPTINVSVVDLTFTPSKATTVEEVNGLVKKASETGPLKGILGYNTLPLVSVDFNHDPRPSIFDSTQTRVSKDGKLVKILSWYDNEWGYSCQMLRATKALMSV